MEKKVVQIHGMSDYLVIHHLVEEPWITFPTSSGDLLPEAVGLSPAKASQTEILGTWAFVLHIALDIHPPRTLTCANFPGTMKNIESVQLIAHWSSLPRGWPDL